jgi:hypothetical protein
MHQHLLEPDVKLVAILHMKYITSEVQEKKFLRGE